MKTVVILIKKSYRLEIMELNNNNDQAMCGKKCVIKQAVLKQDCLVIYCF